MAAARGVSKAMVGVEGAVASREVLVRCPQHTLDTAPKPPDLIL